MQSHPSPGAHVCTTLPPGNLPMRDVMPFINPDRALYTASECGRVRRTLCRQFAETHPQAPIGTWWSFEKRTDDRGEVWIRKDDGIYYVVDDFGFLVRVDGKGGAA